MTARIIYQGNLRNIATHLQSGSSIETDAPTDNKGKGERFSPTDLVCVALATCITTTIAIKAADMQINLDNSTVEVTKHMKSDPRRIGQIDVSIYFSSENTDEKTRTIIERVGNNCPVQKSLHPDIILNVLYHWK